MMKLSPGVKAGIIGAGMLFVILFTFSYYWFFSRWQTSGIIGGLYGPAYVLSFVVSGVLAAYFSAKEIDSAGRALYSGATSGCVAAIMLAVAWLVYSALILLSLDFTTWIGLTLSMLILAMIGVVISALSSVIYAFIDRNFTR